ncbi:menaquinone-dependent protoporphyrinogen IX dehydrogenase [Capnocytophaga canimorsus]|uniref:Protoporphyrinogen IX dehydrogenase [quinone] n=1 Tax=Capnocytophaga canimorsus TaxID=28188 RepID=A0A250G656_9FLAO|nr:menaquinone-dependent protoporphyrinogen IX dehydrogenase [Capnocytophaga canimorsus]ATA91716.1 protoporphyrinogen oxidase [Capnocytophaga canimorsus]
MNKTIIIYATVDGQTQKISQAIAQTLKSERCIVDLVRIDQLQESQVAHYDKIIVASSIRYGKHNKQIIDFINRNTPLLNTKKTAFVSVNLVARKAEKSSATTNPYVVKFIRKIAWKPTVIQVFAGRIDYKLYSLRDRLIIKLIMFITKGPMRSKEPIEYTNWDEVRQFSRNFAQL